MIQLIRHEWAAARVSTKIFVVLAGILCTAGLGIVYYVSKNWHSEIMASDRETVLIESIRPDQQSNPDDAISMNRYKMQQHQILREHFDAIGGARVLSSMVSLSFSGTFIAPDGTRHHIMVTKKNGDSVRITIRTRLTQNTVCVSPSGNWRSISRMNEVIEVEDLPEEEAASHRHYLSVVSELFLASVNGWEMEFEGLEEFNGKLAYRFDVVVNPVHSIRFYVDPQFFQNVGRVDTIQESDGTVSVTKRIHSDHMRAGDLMIPGRVEAYVDGKLTQTLIIDHASMNAGVLDTAFERPVVRQ